VITGESMRQSMGTLIWESIEALTGVFAVLTRESMGEVVMKKYFANLY
jgi:hypothetical protein